MSAEARTVVPEFEEAEGECMDMTRFPSAEKWCSHPAVVEFCTVLRVRDRASALQALDRWKHLPEWPQYWAYHPGETYCSSSNFQDASLKWPWLALRMLDAGLCATASQYKGAAALYSTCAGYSDMEERAQLVQRLLNEGVDVNGLGPMNTNWQGRTPLASVLRCWISVASLPILNILLATPGIQLTIQNWQWDRPVGAPESADKYASDADAKWAVPRLKEALALKAQAETEAGTGVAADV